MGRYDKWEKNEFALLDKLKQDSLFTCRLLPDIQKGEVFPAIRKDKIDFYHLGLKLFSFDGRAFQSNIAYLVAYQNKPKGEIRERKLKDLKLCESFREGYSQIKNTMKLFTEPESEQVSKLWERHSYWLLPDVGPIVVLDIELHLVDDDKSHRIDLVLLDCLSGQIRFFEAKVFKNPGLRKVGNSMPAVIGQIEGYNNQLVAKQNELLASYSQYARILNFLSGVSIPTPKSIDCAVDLIVFDYNAEEEKVMGDVIRVFGNNNFHCSGIGNANNTSQVTLKKWWGRKPCFK